MKMVGLGGSQEHVLVGMATEELREEGGNEAVWVHRTTVTVDETDGLGRQVVVLSKVRH